MSNPRFGWRFFPVALARTPLPLAFPARKPPGTFRVFVFGESAAMGIPELALASAALTEVLVEASYPDVDVEMINTAMTAINSHVVAEIARECVRCEPDAFVIYMGNNEVVGPFGPGTIFTSGAPPQPLVRARLIAQRTDRSSCSNGPRPRRCAADVARHAMARHGDADGAADRG